MWKFKTERLTDLRELKGLSADQFGKAIEKTGPTVINWEKGVGAPTGPDLAAIGNAFQVDPCSFFVKVGK